MPTIALTIYGYLIVVAYVFGGATHVANLTGFGQTPPPAKKTVFLTLDIAYLALNTIVVAGMIIGAMWGFVAFFVAAGSQLVLYVGFADYFASEANQRKQLRGLVHFHLVTAAVMASLLVLT